jgi:hypothetical protein
MSAAAERRQVAVCVMILFILSDVLVCIFAANIMNSVDTTKETAAFFVSLSMGETL